MKKMWFIFFFFKQKTAYEIYQCDWSSDVCSSDLLSRLSRGTQFHNSQYGLLRLPNLKAYPMLDLRFSPLFPTFQECRYGQRIYDLGSRKFPNSMLDRFYLVHNYEFCKPKTSDSFGFTMSVYGSEADRLQLFWSNTLILSALYPKVDDLFFRTRFVAFVPCLAGTLRLSYPTSRGYFTRNS